MKNWNQTSEDNQDSGVLSDPLIFIHNGYYHWRDTNLSNRGTSGNYWSSRSDNSNHTESNSLLFGSSYLVPQNNSIRGMGFAVKLT